MCHSFASVHNHKLASPISLVHIVFHVTPLLLFWLKLQALSWSVANSVIVSAGAITSFFFGTSGNCLVVPLLGFTLQQQRVLSHSFFSQHTKAHHIMNASPLKISGQNCHWRRRLPLPLSFGLRDRVCSYAAEGLRDIRQSLTACNFEVAHKNHRTRIHLLRDSTRTGGRWKILARSESVDFESQVGVVSEVSEASVRFPHGRLQHTSSLVRTVAQENCDLSSWLRGRRTLKFKFRMANARKEAAKRPPPCGSRGRLRSVSATPNARQRSSVFAG